MHNETDAALYVGIDLGGTRLKMGLIDADGTVLSSENQPTTDDRKAIYRAIETYILTCGHPVKGLGMSMPGIIDDTGYAVTSGAIKSLLHQHVQDDLVERLQMPVAVTNDGRSAALAEGWTGAAKDVADYIVFTLGTAIGGGIVIDGKLRGGIGGLAGEFGVALANLCDGHYEEHSFALHAATVAGLCRSYSYAVHERVLDAREIYRRAGADDPIATECIEAFHQAVAIMCVNAAVTIGPELMVIGGGISANEHAMTEIRRRYDDIATAYPILGKVQMPQIKTAVHQNNAGMIGAVRRCLELSA